jgi:predicted MFS family arabinose efflux permease
VTPLTRFALLAVVFVDLIGQGLVFPIINSLMMDRDTGFLPASTPIATREFNYGLVIGIFFLCWFLGAAYIAKASDAIGRKNAIIICLFGALFGYILTIVSLFIDSLWLLIVGRAITGFTAGNQPIAQAAVVDMSATDAERARNMGYIVAGISAGLVGGPIIGGVLSDREIVGDLASITLPFYAAMALVAITIVLILVSFTDVRQAREKYRFEPLEIFTLLLRIFRHPVVSRPSLVFFCFMLANVSFYIFFDNYLTARFGIGLFGTSMAMMVLGITVATSSSLLVEPAQARFSKSVIVAATSAVMAISALVFALADAPLVCYLTIGTFYFGFGVAYPTLLGIFSASVGENEQGWVMGITTAQFTLAAGIVSLVGGDLMGIDVRFPFFVTIGAALLALLMMVLTWRTAAIRQITRK